ncbi:MAG: polysaccharide biosynthesis protein [Clostridia bacterium]|nr:polysaccharide biosynthesis protein [Clostridia bacterium]
MNTQKRKEPRMLTGVLLLTLAGVAEKILGVILKIPLAGYLGSEGMGYFNSAYNIFTTFYTVAVTGLPVATSIMVSKSRARGRKLEVNRIFRVSISLFLTVGIIGSAIMYFGAGFIANLIDDNNNSQYCIQAIAPILLLICVSSSIRGFFQGHQNMMPSAVSEFLDAFGKCALGICFGGYAVTHGYSVEVSAAAAIAGIVIGHLFGMGFLIITKCVSKPDYSCLGTEVDEINSESSRSICKKMLLIALPVTLGSLALGLTSTIDTFTIMRVLKSDNAMGLYGDYTTLAVTLYRLPHALIVPISTSLTPMLSAAISSGNADRTKSTLFSAFKMTAILSIPCSIGMGVLARPIISMLFGGSYPKEIIQNTAPLLSVLSFGTFLMAMLTITSAVLQSYGKQHLPVISMTCGTVAKLILNIVLISNFGIIGAPIATAASYFVMVAINFVFVITYSDIDAKIFKAFLPPLIAMLCCVPVTVGSFMLYAELLPREAVATLLSVLTTALVYAFALFATRAFSREDIMMLPKGKKIYAMLVKMKLMR